MNLTHIRKVLQCEEGDTVHVSASTHEGPKHRVLPVPLDDPGDRLARHIDALECSGYQVSETDSTIVATSRPSDVPSRTYTLYFEEPTAPWPLRRELETFVEEIDCVTLRGRDRARLRHSVGRRRR